VHCMMAGIKVINDGSALSGEHSRGAPATATYSKGKSSTATLEQVAGLTASVSKAIHRDSETLDVQDRIAALETLKLLPAGELDDHVAKLNNRWTQSCRNQSDEGTIDSLQHIFRSNRSFYEDELTTSNGGGCLMRVLDTGPGDFGDAISCSLRAIELTDFAPHAALTYAWRSTDATDEIMVNGLTGIPVTGSLHRALRPLRQHNVESVWIDALCINQATDTERSAQVALMKQIHQSARVVYVWLGHVLSSVQMTRSQLSVQNTRCLQEVH